MFTIKDLHYNSRNLLQVNPKENYDHLSLALDTIQKALCSGSPIEQKMWSFFEREIEPKEAYHDHELNQGPRSQQRLYVVGFPHNSPFEHDLQVRIGVDPQDDVCSAVQFMYLQPPSEGASSKLTPRFFNDFNPEYSGMVDGYILGNEHFFRAWQMIPQFQQAILQGDLLLW